MIYTDLAARFCSESLRQEQNSLFHQGAQYSIKKAPQGDETKSLLSNKSIVHITIKDSQFFRKNRYLISCIQELFRGISRLLRGKSFRPYLRSSQGLRAHLPFTAKHVATYFPERGGRLFIRNQHEAQEEIKKIKTQYQSLKSQTLLEIPLSTCIGKEAHAVSLIIDTKNQKIYFIDSKGSKPENLHFYFNAPPKPTKVDYTAAEFLQMLQKEVVEENFEIVATPAFQKVGDCAATTEVMVRSLAAIRETEENSSSATDPYFDILAALTITHENYDVLVTQGVRPELQQGS